MTPAETFEPDQRIAERSATGLRGCPFCGNTKLSLITFKPNDDGEVLPICIQCDECLASGPHGASQEQLRAMWDVRHAPPPAVWQPIETAPQLKAVLIHYKNACNKGRTIKARFVPRYTEESTGESEGESDEYCEERDQYFLIEGWYEQIDNWGEFTEVFVSETPAHWMPLPPAPTGSDHE